MSHIKRFFELFQGDPAFREAVRAGDSGPLDQWGLGLDLAALRPLWSFEEGLPPDEAAHPAVRAFWKRRERLQRPHRAAGPTPAPQSDFARWRERQVHRTMAQTNPTGWANPHYPFAVELSVGCSIGCDYCCFDAPRLAATARFTESNATLFRGLLDAARAFFGSSAASGFLYWATEPLDNPDYERYVGAFRSRLGAWPRTTTAAWYRDTARTRRLLGLARAHGEAANVRFSVSSLGHLHHCLREFSADELADVPLVLQNPESTAVKCAVGRARDHARAVPDHNSNLTGVLVNLVDRSAKLVSPSSQLERWPLGYAVYAEAGFRNGPDLERILREWERDVMNDRFGTAYVPRLREDLRIGAPGGEQPGRTLLSNGYTRTAIADPVAAAILHCVDGRRTVAAIADRLLKRGTPPWTVYPRFRQLYEAGLFEVEPQPKTMPRRQASDARGGRDGRLERAVAALGRSDRAVVG